MSGEARTANIALQPLASAIQLLLHDISFHQSSIGFFVPLLMLGNYLLLIHRGSSKHLPTTKKTRSGVLVL